MHGPKNPVKEYALDILFCTLGCLCAATSATMFYAPNNIAPGGVTGISILVNYLTGLPISFGSLGLNLPLLALAFVFLGRRFTLRTMATVGIFTVLMRFAEVYMPVYQGETILAALYGGVLSGLGIGLVFTRSATTGGMEIVARLIQRKRPDFSTGKLLLALDACVLICAAIVYQNMESALFALISIFTSSRVVDSVIYGQDVSRMIMVISAKHEEIVQCIREELSRGCTLLSAQGGYTQQDRPVVMCAVRRAQYHQLKRAVRQVDPEAFIVALEAGEVVGKGFKDINA